MADEAAAADDLSEFHRYEDAAKMARQGGDLESADQLRQVAAQHLYTHYQNEAAASGQNDPTSGMSGGDKLAAGVGQGATDVWRHLKNMFGATSDEEMANAKATDAALLNTKEGMLGSMLGQTAATSLGTMGLGTAAGLGVNALKAAQLTRLANLAGKGVGAASKLVANPVARAATEGAAQGAVMTDPTEGGMGRVGNALLGAGLGVAFPAAGAVGKRIFRGVDRTPEARLLISKGIYPTLGQMKPHGILATLEQTPGIKQAINILGARKGIRNEYLRAAAQEVAPAGTVIKASTPQDMLKQAYDSFQPLYDQAKGFPVGAYIMGNTNVPLKKEIAGALAGAARVTDDHAAAVNKWFKTMLQDKIDEARKLGRGLQSEDLLDIRHFAREESRAYGAAVPSMESRGMKDGFDIVNKKLTKALESQLTPVPKGAKDPMAALLEADSHYGDYKKLEEAYSAANAAGRGLSGPTTGEITRAISAGEGTRKGMGKTAAALGQNQSGLKKLADAASATFAEQPEMRTGHGMGALASIAGFGALLGHPLAIPAATIGTILGSGTRSMRKAAAGATGWQQTARKVITGAAKGMSPRSRSTLKNLRSAASELSQRAAIADLAGPSSMAVTNNLTSLPGVGQYVPLSAMPTLGEQE